MAPYGARRMSCSTLAVLFLPATTPAQDPTTPTPTPPPPAFDIGLLAGLKARSIGQTEHMHRILLHPTDPAFGTPWGENGARGVFTTGTLPR